MSMRRRATGVARPQQKKAPGRWTGRFALKISEEGLRRLLLLRLLGRGAGVLALGGGVALDELDHGHRRHVAEAVAGLQDAQVAAVAAGVARAQRGEQLVGNVGVAQEANRLAASVQATLLAERDQLLDDRTQVLRLVQRGRDLLVLDERAGE